MDFRFAFSTKIAEDWNNMTGIKMIYEINNKNEESLLVIFGIQNRSWMGSDKDEKN